MLPEIAEGFLQEGLTLVCAHAAHKRLLSIHSCPPGRPPNEDVGWFSMSPLPSLHHHDIMTTVGLFLCVSTQKALSGFQGFHGSQGVH